MHFPLFIPYIIWSNERGAYWAPAERGYTGDIRKAGRYARERAMTICEQAGKLGRAWIGDYIPAEICFLAPEVHDMLIQYQQKVLASLMPPAPITIPADMQVLEQPDVATIEPDDDTKDRAICEQCEGTGLQGPARQTKCWWCEGRGYRL